jgi:4-hydroxy-4-methyl-2-oxoglutarate aldolase
MNSDVIGEFPRVSAQLVQRASQFQPAILADVAGRRGALHGRIQPLRPQMKLAGPAFTVEVRPGDNLMIHAALMLAKPGDVIVVDGKGDLNAALMGAIMMNVCRERGLAGVVIDGAVRDTLELAELGLPVFAAGANANGPTKSVAGRVGLPVTVGGVTVHPGDYVCGDADGVVVIERERLESLLPAAHKKVAGEAARIEAIRQGDTAAKWLVAALRTAGVLAATETL